VWDVDLIMVGFVRSLGGKVDKLEDEWSSSDDAAASREEVLANDVFEYGRLARGLRAYDDLLRC
jgi:hypothetical protein